MIKISDPSYASPRLYDCTDSEEYIVVEALRRLRDDKVDAMHTLNAELPATQQRPFTEKDMGINTIDKLLTLIEGEDQ